MAVKEIGKFEKYRAEKKAAITRTVESARNRVGFAIGTLAVVGLGSWFGARPLVEKGIVETWKNLDNVDTVQQAAIVTATVSLAYLTGSAMINKPPVPGTNNRQKARIWAGSALATSLLIAGTVAAASGDSKNEGISRPPAVTSPAPENLPSTSAVALVPIDLGEGTACEIVPYFRDSETIAGDQAAIDRRAYSAVLLKKYLTTTGEYTGQFTVAVDGELKEAVNKAQERLGINPALPWNLDTCVATPLGDGQPGPDLSQVVPAG